MRVLEGYECFTASDEAAHIHPGGRSKQITEQVEDSARRVSDLESSYKRNIVNEYTRQAHERLFAYRPEQYPLQREGRTALQLNDMAPAGIDR